MGVRIKLIRKRGSTKLKVRHKIKHHKGAIRIKKLKNSKTNYTAKRERKCTRKPDEGTVRINKLNDFEVDIYEDKRPVAGQKPSHTLLFYKVESSVSAMLQLRDVEATSKNVPLFMDEGQPVHLVVQCIRIPEMCNQHFRFCLPHPLIDKSSEVCLIVPDLKKGKHIDHEPTVEHYKNLLEKNNITGISQVMPLRQLKVEYDQYELRRRLVSQFDLFLSDGRIAGHTLELLGKEVYKRRKLPVAVNMRAKNLRIEFEKCLSKTLMMMNAHGNKAALKVGHTKQSVKQISENIMAVAKCLAERYPGGWDNIRSLHIHLQDSPLIPIYISLKSSNEVAVPVVKPVIPKKAKPVEGELTTFPGTHVTVMPSGEVIVKKMERTKEDIEMGLSDSDWEEYNSDEEMDVGSEDEVPTVNADEKTKVEPQPDPEEGQDSEDSDDGNEETVEAAEDAYLNEWTKQWNANVETNNEAKEEPEKKKRKIVKSKKDKQKVTESKIKTLGRNKQKKSIAIKIMEKSQPDSKEPKLSKKDKTESIGSLGLPNRKSAQNKLNKGQKVHKKGHKKTLLTKLAKKKLNVWKTEQISQNDAAVK
ncbi:hypothetical protein B7P43_G08406 [Cryptotermes secundus]|uniref:Ribosomal L1 domain-containing protein 1 n=1 Tax=Cryptotermes secundus TaxID=105785 RepID=A0A2J7PXG5_9NEOP|nr:ribosomal L1 domain-containing protein 1 isoform X2 [Cryptotermes secundus]PNF21030.1 hypothetical protein B7P43_G08406 [Cryptotermes secundus]PNF21031.1 hypothetical protein B7P43_G08406 [Cryptotermes secundus]